MELVASCRWRFCGGRRGERGWEGGRWSPCPRVRQPPGYRCIASMLPLLQLDITTIIKSVEVVYRIGTNETRNNRAHSHTITTHGQHARTRKRTVTHTKTYQQGLHYWKCCANKSRSAEECSEEQIDESLVHQFGTSDRTTCTHGLLSLRILEIM